MADLFRIADLGLNCSEFTALLLRTFYRLLFKALQAAAQFTIMRFISILELVLLVPPMLCGRSTGTEDGRTCVLSGSLTSTSRIRVV